jgi:hypothetical protein
MVSAAGDALLACARADTHRPCTTQPHSILHIPVYLLQVVGKCNNSNDNNDKIIAIPAAVEKWRQTEPHYFIDIVLLF